MTGFEARVLDGPPEGWDALLASNLDATPAQRPALWRALEAVLPEMSLRCVAVASEGALMGGAPVFVERRAGLHWIHALPYMLPGAPLAPPAALRAVDLAVGEAIAELQRSLGAVGGAWSLYRPCGPGVEAEALERPAGETRGLETALIDLDQGIEAVWRRLGRDERHTLRRARRLGLSVAEEPEALEAAYALYLARARGWRGRRPLPLELSRRLLSPLGPKEAPAARLFTVRNARRLLGASLVLDHDREMLAWWAGAHPAARELPAMRFLYWSVAEWAAGAGRRRLNLGGSIGRPDIAEFKRSIGARFVAHPVRWLDARHASRLGRWAAVAQARLRRRRFRGVSE